MFDEFRGFKGAFKRVINTIRLLVKYGIKVEIIATIFRDNLKEMSAIAKLVLEDLGADFLKFSPCLLVGRAQVELKDRILAVDEIIKYSKIVRSIARTYPKRVTGFLPLALCGPVHEILGVCNYKNILSILPDGSISLCGVGINHSELCFGNIRRDSIIEIWKRNSTLNKLRNTKPTDFEGVCSICIFRSVCANFCPAYAYEVYGSLTASFPICQQLYEANMFPKQFLLE